MKKYFIVIVVLCAFIWIFLRSQKGEQIPSGKTGPFPALELVSSNRQVIPLPMGMNPSTSIRKEKSVGEKDFQVQVVDEQTEKPLKGATVTVEGPHGFLEKGLTGTSGRWSFSAEEDSFPLQVTTALSDFIPTRKFLDVPPSETILILLKYGARLAGTVVNPEGQPAGSGISVLALPSSSLPETFAHLLGSEGAESGLDVAKTNSEGHFLFTTLEPGRPVFLIAGGDGSVGAEQPVKVSLPLRDPVVLKIYPVFGLLVRCQGKDKEPIKTSPRLFQSFKSISSKILDPDARSIGHPFNDFRLGLAGIPVSVLETYDSQDLLFTKTSIKSKRHLGPVQAAISLPGYKPLQFSFFLPPLRKGLEVRTINLIATESGWGYLHISFVPPYRFGLRKDVESGKTLVGTFSMNRSDGNIFEFGVSGFSEQTIHGIPAGIYDISFETINGLFQFPIGDAGELQVSISSNQTSRIEIPLGDLGRISFEILDQQNKPFSGPLEVMIRSMGNQGDFIKDFSRSPYTLEMVPPGKYQIADILALDRPELHFPFPEVEVFSGEEAKVRVLGYK